MKRWDLVVQVFMPSDKNNKAPASKPAEQGLEGDAQHLLMAERGTLWGKAKTDNSEAKWLNGELDAEHEEGFRLS